MPSAPVELPAAREFGVVKFRGLVAAGIFSALVEFLMGFLGTVLASHHLGEAALAGVSLLSPVMTAVIFLSALFGSGLQINCSLALGRGERRRSWEFFTQGLWSVLGVGLALAAAMYVGGELYVAYFSPLPEVARHALDYWRYYALVPLLEMLVVFEINCCYTDGDSWTCCYAYVAQLAVNLACSLWLLKAGWGAGGCALGAGAGFAAAAVVLSTHFVRKTNSFRLVRHFAFGDTLRLMRSSFGDAAAFLCNALFYFCIAKFFLFRYGAEVMPTVGVVLATFGLSEAFGGIGNAAQSVAGVYAGEGNLAGVRRVMEAALRMAAIVSGLAAVALLVYPELMIAIAGLESPLQVGEAKLAVRLVALGFIPRALSNILNGYYVMMERERLAIGFTFWEWLGVQLLAVAAGAAFAPFWVFLAIGLAPTLGLAAFALLKRRIDAGAFPLYLDRAREAKQFIFDLELAPEGVVKVAGAVAEQLRKAEVAAKTLLRARLLVEEVLLAVRDHNGERKVLAEVTLDLNDGVHLTLRDDGEIFDITDADRRADSFRAFFVASVMERQHGRLNLVTTGFNRNAFVLEKA